MNRPTPETDSRKAHRNASGYNIDLADLIYMHQLERERDEARELVRELRDALEFISKQNCRDKRMIAEMVAGMRKAARDALDKAWEVLP